MSISTKSGDSGTTSLWSGERRKKNDARVEAYGTVDELNAFLGEAKHMVNHERIRAMIIEIQNDLFNVAGALASTKDVSNSVLDADVTRITNYVYEFEAEVKLTGFVIPGSTLPSAKLDVCRTIARRAERRILTLHDLEPVPGPVRTYMNRLSDLIYMMARFLEQVENKLEFYQRP
ncbi:MAG: cob(I)yrinic acid a,c-diamide adenosyltransferase [Candidatus Omnitrophota bacterium]